ncbi:uncharacterized protein [Diadema antillarum]|uniref:uncharacterized protein n=1 Tax=Diadema antillarum TaxID=105358 RepID=UPI003A86D345
MAEKIRRKTIYSCLTCPLCFDIFANPTLLHCGHTFCKRCLLEYDKSQAVTWSDMVCPLCRQTTVLQVNRVEGLPSNTAISNILDHLQSSESVQRSLREPSTLCTACEDRTPALSFCRDCHASLCEACTMRHRQMPLLFVNHRVISIEEALELGDKTDLRPTNGKGMRDKSCQDLKDDDASSTGSSGSDSIERQIGNGHDSVAVLAEVNLPGRAVGMAKMTRDRVVVTFGRFASGAFSYSLGGSQSPHLSENEGKVYDIVFLSDGRSVAALADGILKVYNSDGSPTDISLVSQNNAEGYYSRLCRDECNRILAVNRTNQIVIHSLGDDCPPRVVSTGSLIPRQVNVTKTGLIITSTCDIVPSRVTVFDSTGHMGSTLESIGYPEYLFATLDLHDRMLVARVMAQSIKLSLYTLDGTRLVQQVEWPELFLRGITPSWCYMAYLSCNTLALASSKLYFIHIPDW